MSHPLVKLGILFGVPPLVFLLALVLGWRAAAPAVEQVDEPEAERRLGPRLRAERAILRGERSMVDQLEARITRTNPPLPAIHYDAEGMEEAIRKSSWVGNGCHQNHENIDYGRGWAQTAPEEMLAWLATKDGKRYEEAHYLFDEWAEVSPQRALEASLSLPDPTLRAQALMSSLNHLTKDDPALARETLEENLSLYSAGTFESVYYDFYVGWRTVDMIASLPSSKERTHLMAVMINRMNQAKATSDYWNGLSMAEKEALVEAGMGVSHTTRTNVKIQFEDLRQLLRKRAEKTGDADIAEALIQNHGKDWVAQDFMGAQDWVNQHMTGMARYRALENLWSDAAFVDLETVVAQWRQLPEGNFKDDMSREILRGAWNREEEAKKLLGIE